MLVYEREMNKALSKFLDKVEGYESDDNCWNWIGTILWTGYGQFRFKGRHWLAHRWIYLYCYKSLEPRKTIDHLCANRRCVNPLHLEEILHSENISRGFERRRRSYACAHVYATIEEFYYNRKYTQKYIAEILDMNVRAVQEVLWRTQRRRIRNR